MHTETIGPALPAESFFRSIAARKSESPCVEITESGYEGVPVEWLARLRGRRALHEHSSLPVDVVQSYDQRTLCIEAGFSHMPRQGNAVERVNDPGYQRRWIRVLRDHVCWAQR